MLIFLNKKGVIKIEIAINDRFIVRTGMRFKEFQELYGNKFTITYKEDEKYYEIPIINAWLTRNDKSYMCFIAIRFEKTKDGDGILDRLWCLSDETTTGLTIIPRKEFQDHRFATHKRLLREALGKPTIENSTYIKYQFDGAYLICEQIFQGRYIFNGAYVEIFFQK